MNDETHDSHQPKPPNIQWFHRLRNWLWGYDFFICYHWVSGGVYAVNLAAQLRQRGYDVFLDRSEYAMGDDWKQVGELALRNTRRLVLIGTREAVFESAPVKREVAIFTDRNRHLIPIFFGDSFEAEEQANPGKHLILTRLPDATLYVEDAIQNLPIGPKAEVVDKLAAAHRIMRRRTLRSTITLTTLSLLLGFAVFATHSWYNAVASRNAEIRQKRAAVDNNTQMQLALADSFREKGKFEDQLHLYAQAAIEGLEDSPATRASQQLLANWASLLELTVVHDNPVYHVSVHPDGNKLLTVDGRRTVRIWELPSGKLLSENPESNVFQQSGQTGMEVPWYGFTPDGKSWYRLKNEPIKFYDAQTNTLVFEVEKYRGPITQVEFSGDGALFATSIRNTNEVIVRNARTGEDVVVIPAQPKGVISLAFSKDDQRLATGAYDGTVRVWNLDKIDDEPKEFPHEGWITALEFDEFRNLLAVGTNKSTLTLWNLDSNEQKPILQGELPSPYPTEVSTVGFGRTHVFGVCREIKHFEIPEIEETKTTLPATHEWPRFAYCGMKGNKVRLWNRDTQQTELIECWHSEKTWRACLSPDESFVVTASKDGTARIRSVTTPRKGAEVSGDFSNPNSKQSIDIDVKNNRRINVFFKRVSLKDGEKYHTLKVDPFPPKGSMAGFYACCFGPDGKLVAAGGGDSLTSDSSYGIIYLWDPASRKRISDPCIVDSSVKSLCWHPEGAYLAAATSGQIHVYEVEKNRWFQINDHSISSISHLEFVGDGNKLLASNSSELAFWQIDDWELVRKLSLNDGQREKNVWHVESSASGKHLATGHEDGFVRIWEVDTGHQLEELSLRNSSRELQRVADIAFTPDGQHMVASSFNGTIGIWQTNPWVRVSSKSLQYGSVTNLAISPNCSMFASCGRDFVQIWDLFTGQPLGEPFWFKQPNQVAHLQTSISHLAFSPDSRRLLLDQGTSGFADIVLPIPAQLDETRLRLSIEVRTGMKKENSRGVPEKIGSSEWQDRVIELQALGGPCDVSDLLDLGSNERECTTTVIEPF